MSCTCDAVVQRGECPVHVAKCICFEDPWQFEPNCPRHGAVSATSLETGRLEKPAVTREEYDRARAVFDALPAGIYVHCSKCSGWYKAGTISMDSNGAYCEGCS